MGEAKRGMTGRLLHLVLTFHWYDEIASGRKTVEYRKSTPFWRKRIWEKHPDSVVFHRGYTKERMVFKVDHVIWREEQVEIHLGERVEVEE